MSWSKTRTTYISRFHESWSGAESFFFCRSTYIMLLSIHQVTAQELPFTLRSIDGGIMSSPSTRPRRYAATLNSHLSRKLSSVPRSPWNVALASSMHCTWASCSNVQCIEEAKCVLVTPVPMDLMLTILPSWRWPESASREVQGASLQGLIL